MFKYISKAEVQEQELRETRQKLETTLTDIEKLSANLNYIAMMADVEMYEEDEAENE